MNNFTDSTVPETMPHLHGFMGLPNVFNPIGFIQPVSAEMKAWFEGHKLEQFAEEVDDEGRFFFTDLEAWDHICTGIEVRGFEMMVDPRN